MKNILLSLLIVIAVTIALTTTVSAQAECPSDDAFFCSQYELAKQGNANAQYNLGVMYEEGVGIAEDKREAVRWYRKAAEQGHASAQFNLGLMYAKGKGVITDYHEAYIWLSIAKANGSKAATSFLDKIDFSVFLTVSEIKSARREAARRLEAIDQLIKQGKADSSK